MKKGTLILALAVCLVGLTGQAWAGTTDQISVTVSLGSIISVDLDANTWTIGAITVSGTPEASPQFTAENDGNVDINLDIKASNGANSWLLGSPAASDTFEVTVTTPSLTLTISDQALTTNLAPAATKTIDMTYTPPTADTQGGGVDHSFSVTVTASLYIP